MKTLRLVWVQTTCDHCSAPGLRVLVPQNTDGSVAGREFPSLCRVCHDVDEIREKTIKKLVDAEGATNAEIGQGRRS